MGEMIGCLLNTLPCSLQRSRTSYRQSLQPRTMIQLRSNSLIDLESSTEHTSSQQFNEQSGSNIFYSLLCFGIYSYQATEILDKNRNSVSDEVIEIESLPAPVGGGQNSKENPVVEQNSHENTKLDRTIVGEGWKLNSSPSISDLWHHFTKLSKFKLTMFVVSTAVAGYYLDGTKQADMSTVGCLSLGTFLCSASASAFNQLLEIPYDSQMVRTKDRPLVKGTIRPFSAFMFGCVTAVTGTVLLYSRTNLTTALLGVSNIFLYAGAYTYSKRHSIVNTWVGAIVGAIPPLMGATARAGCFDKSCTGGVLMAGLLYAWQFPHFNSLSWKYKAEYARAGYQMMSVTDPQLCRSVAWNYSLLLAVPISYALDRSLQLRGSYVVASTALVNSGLVWLSWKFSRQPNNATARSLFLYSLWHLLGSLSLIGVCKVLCSQFPPSV